LKSDFKDGAIFIFYDALGNFRFSFIRRNYDDDSGKYTPHKRYTYFVDPSKKNTTFKRRIDGCSFDSLDEIQKAFSVEPLSKQFYKDLSHWYFASLREVKFPNDRNENEYSLHANAMIRLITRIMFVWFMKQKGLVPNELFDKEKIDELLDYSDSNNSTYYKAILQNLFFATLNTPRSKGRKWVSRQYGVQNFYRYKRFLNDPDHFLKLMDSVPFLNGGLFENLDIVKPEEGIEIRIDCFSDPKKNESKLKVPDYLFFGTRNADISEYFESGNYGNIEITGLIDILNRYDFTIDENTPYDQEVALDPELLGLVFENLLASYNPETQSTARKESGSFYTPRPIVDYMVEESLAHYISNDTGLSVEKLREVFSSSDTQPFDQESDRSSIIDSISNLKIIDPACGSGAFPMGALQKMVHALNKLDKDSKLFRNAQEKLLRQKLKDTAESATLEELKEEMDAIFDNHLNDPDYARKLHLIKHCLYGVDIQPIAMQISKLRFFISLLVEQHIDKEDDNFGIIALPNLETKFVAANTLIKLTETAKRADQMLQGRLQNIKIEKLKKQLQKVRNQYFGARTSKSKQNNRIKDKKLREEIAQLLVDDGFAEEKAKMVSQWDPFNPNSKAKWFDQEWMFGIEDFDIVIGNPPYIQLQKALPGHEEIKYADVYKDFQYQTFERTGDIYALFYEKGLEILHSKGILCFITSNSWMHTKYGKSLRELFSKKNPVQLLELGPDIFEAAVVDVNVLLIQNSHHHDIKLKSIVLDKKEDINLLKNEDFTLQATLSSEPWLVLPKSSHYLKVKIDRIGKELQSWDININFGIKTGYNAAFIIDDKTKDELIAKDNNSKKLIKRVIRGRDISRYKSSFSNKYLLFIPWHFPLHENIEIKKSSSKAEAAFRSGFPAVYNHLLQNKERLSKRNQAETGIRYEWYCLQRWAASYWNDFQKPKIIWGEISDSSKFCFDDQGYFMEATGFIMTGEKLIYLCCLLNSKLSEWYFHLIGTTTGMGTNRWKKYKIQRLPVLYPDGPIEENFKMLFNSIQSKKESNQDSSQEELKIDLMVYKLYELTYDEVLIIDPDTPIEKKAFEAFDL